MFIPECFTIDDEEAIYDFIEEYSFATLFSQHNGEPYATHLPLLLDRDQFALYGHMARANKQWEEVGNQQVLAVFHGPHCYISPIYYETTKAVPTWDYVSIHVYGKMEIVSEKNVILHTLNSLVNKYEKADSSYHYLDLDSSMVEGMIRELVAFKIKITKIEAQAKLSQNHPVERQEMIVKHLENNPNQNDKQIAALIKRNLIKK